MPDPVVLCVDDDPGMRCLYEAMFGRSGYEVIVVSNGDHALTVYQFAKNVDAVILDREMPGMDGDELAERLKQLNPLLPILMVSGTNPELEEMSPFVDASLAKGVPIRNILDRVELLLAEREQPAEHVALPV